MEDLLRLKKACRADVLSVEIESGIVHVKATRYCNKEVLSRQISVMELEDGILPPYETLKRLMHEFIDLDDGMLPPYETLRPYRRRNHDSDQKSNTR